MRQQNRSRDLAVIIERKPRIGQLARLPQFFNRRIIFAQRQQNVGGGRLRLRCEPETRSSSPPAPDSNFARLSNRSWWISASCRCHWWDSCIVNRCHIQPVDNVRVQRTDPVPVLVQNKAITAGHNWRQRKILFVRHRRRDDAGKIKMLAFGFPFVFELLPRVSAAPVFLGVKQRNQSDEAREAKKSPRNCADRKANV